MANKRPAGRAHGGDLFRDEVSSVLADLQGLAEELTPVVPSSAVQPDADAGTAPPVDPATEKAAVAEPAATPANEAESAPSPAEDAWTTALPMDNAETVPSPAARQAESIAPPAPAEAAESMPAPVEAMRGGAFSPGTDALPVPAPQAVEPPPELAPATVVDFPEATAEPAPPPPPPIAWQAEPIWRTRERVPLSAAGPWPAAPVPPPPPPPPPMPTPAPVTETAPESPGGSVEPPRFSPPPPLFRPLAARWPSTPPASQETAVPVADAGEPAVPNPVIGPSADETPETTMTAVPGPANQPSPSEEAAQGSAAAEPGLPASPPWPLALESAPIPLRIEASGPEPAELRPPLAPAGQQVPAPEEMDLPSEPGIDAPEAAAAPSAPEAIAEEAADRTPEPEVRATDEAAEPETRAPEPAPAAEGERLALPSMGEERSRAWGTHRPPVTTVIASGFPPDGPRPGLLPSAGATETTLVSSRPWTLAAATEPLLPLTPSPARPGAPAHAETAGSEAAAARTGSAGPPVLLIAAVIAVLVLAAAAILIIRLHLLHV